MDINVSQRVDAAPISAFQIRIVALCALVALLDGLDIQTMAIATPRIARTWGLVPADFGPVLSASFAGIMFGTILLGQLGDRLGRRPVVIFAFLILGLVSILTAFAQDVGQMIVLRFITGIAIGGCLPNVTALTTEYMPRRHSGLAVTLMYSAVPLGGVFGSLVASSLIASIDWQGIFLLGGVVPLLICVLLFCYLPESARFLVARGRDDALVGHTLSRIDRAYMYAQADVFTIDSRVRRATVGALFRDGRRYTTMLVWVVFFFSMAVMYLLNSWLPTIFAAAGWPMAQAIRTLAFFQLGGIVGGLLGGWLLDRVGPYRVLVGAFALGTTMLAFIGVSDGPPNLVRAMVTAAGFGLIGGQIVLTAVSAILYPTAMRSTGIGWALGVGRFGAVVSPLLGGVAMKAGLSGRDLILSTTVPALICVAGTLLLARIGVARDADIGKG